MAVWKSGAVWRSGVRGVRRHWLAITVPLAIVLLLAFGVAFMTDEPLRRYTEAKVNRALRGYTARIMTLDFHPLGFLLDLQNVTVTQDAHPDPAVLHIERLSASVHWRALLRGRLVADIAIEKPTVHVNLPQARREIDDPVPVEERGWREALEAVYPLKINHFEVRGGDVTYVDQGPFKPLRLRNLNLVATNIRNVRSKDQIYPSEIRVSAAVFESGRVAIDGRADFMAEPHPTFRGNVDLANIELDYFKPITNRYNVWVDKGVLSASGAVEYGRVVKTVELNQATIEGIHVDYVHTAWTDVAEWQRAGQAAAVAKDVSNKPGVLVRIVELRLVKSTVGYVNKAAATPYHVFLTDTDGMLKNLSNHEVEGAAVAKLKGKFMGSGVAVAEATFRAEKSGPAFDIAVRIEEVSVPTMNDLLRAYGRFDAAEGRFFFYSELSARNGLITGYVKPVFKDMKIYASDQEKGKPFTRKVYERLVGGVAKLLENRSREEVATKSDVSGRIDNPRLSVVDVVLRLVQNAFFKAILPGFDLESGRAERVRRTASR
jgi:Domain of Unknown Function (DUF748)